MIESISAPRKRAQAEQMTDQAARSGMLQIAKSYEEIARRAEERIVLHKKHEGFKP